MLTVKVSIIIDQDTFVECITSTTIISSTYCYKIFKVYSTISIERRLAILRARKKRQL